MEPSPPAKCVSREYSAAVQSANEMAERIGLLIIHRYNEQSNKYQLEYSREKTKLQNSLKQISERTIEFDLEEFRLERRRQLKPPPPQDVLVPKKILQAVPANCVLDFGPGNSIMYYGGEKYRKGVIPRNSVLAHPIKKKQFRQRPFTAMPLSKTKRQSTTTNGRNTSLGFHTTSGRMSSLSVSPRMAKNSSRPLTAAFRMDSIIDSKDDLNSDDSDTEYNHKSSRHWDMPNRSYRALKKLYTYTEEEKPDYTAERFKLMKTRETSYFKYLEAKVREFHV